MTISDLGPRKTRQEEQDNCRDYSGTGSEVKAVIYLGPAP